MESNPMEARIPSVVKSARPVPRAAVNVNVALTVAALLVPVISLILCYHYPDYASAFYAFTGREIAHGKQMYHDVWDNKLPSIYYLNALWQVLFGERYELHRAAQVGMSAITIGAFALFVRRDGVRHWGIATICFAILVSIPGFQAYGYTETYALCAIVLALVALQAGSPVASGIFLALGATFWIPGSLTAFAFAAFCSGETRRRFLAAFAGTALLYAALVVAAFGAATIFTLLHDMRTYESVSWSPHASMLGILKNDLWGRLNQTALLVPLALLVAFLRVPRIRRERFALLWLGCVFAGAMVNLHFYDHYFFPSTAPLAYALVVFAENMRWTWRRCAIVAVVVLALVAHGPKMVRHFSAIYNGELEMVHNSAVVSQVIAASLPPKVPILVDPAEAGIYLRTGRDAPGPLTNGLTIDRFMRDRDGAREREYLAELGRAGAFVAQRNDPPRQRSIVAALAKDFVPACDDAGLKFRIYFKRALHVVPRCAAAND
jgi:hypothetical protein